MKVSICIPTFNQEKYVEIAIRSAFQQSMAPYEIIVSNDCSTDDTKIILDKLEKEIEILKVIHQPVNLGIAKNVDSCLRSASGDYIVRLDSDDYLFPEYIEKLSNQFKLYPEAGYAHAAVQEIDQNGNHLTVRSLARKSGFQSGNEALQKAVNGYKVSANIIFFSRKALEKVDYVSFNINFAEDYYMVTAISAAGFGNIYLNEVLSKYRVWVDGGKVRQKRKLAEIDGLTSIFTNLLEPAFKKRNWDIAAVNSNRANFANIHASCLAWNVYSKAEKEELVNALYKLSSAISVKFHVWAYLNGLGFLFFYKKTVSKAKVIIKKLLY